MTARAPRIYTSPEDIHRLEQRVDELAINGRVRLHLRDGNVVEGIVAVKATVQILRDASGNEGINGSVKLEDPEHADRTYEVWLDEVERIERMDSVTPGASKA